MTTTVTAPPDEVWRLFTDLDRWPQMNQSITALRRLDSGPLKIGSEAVIRQPPLPPARWRVTELDPGRSFTWETTSPGVTGVGAHLVEADGQGSVITLTLRMHGPLARLVHLLTGKLTQRNLMMELDGFRRAATPG